MYFNTIPNTFATRFSGFFSFMPKRIKKKTPHRPLWSFPFPLISVYNVSQSLPSLMFFHAHKQRRPSADEKPGRHAGPMHAGRAAKERELGLGQKTPQRLFLASLSRYEASLPALGTDDSRPTLFCQTPTCPNRFARAPLFLVVMRAGVRSAIAGYPFCGNHCR